MTTSSKLGASKFKYQNITLSVQNIPSIQNIITIQNIISSIQAIYVFYVLVIFFLTIHNMKFSQIKKKNM